MSRALADTIVLGGATLCLIPLCAYIWWNIYQSPAPPPWRPKIVRDAMRIARLKRFAHYRGRAFAPARIKRLARRREDYEFAPLPLILIGYFEGEPS